MNAMLPPAVTSRRGRSRGVEAVLGASLAANEFQRARESRRQVCTCDRCPRRTRRRGGPPAAGAGSGRRLAEGNAAGRGADQVADDRDDRGLDGLEAAGDTHRGGVIAGDAMNIKRRGRFETSELLKAKLDVRAGPRRVELFADIGGVGVAALGLEGFRKAEERSGDCWACGRGRRGTLLGGSGVAGQEELGSERLAARAKGKPAVRRRRVDPARRRPARTRRGRWQCRRGRSRSWRPGRARQSRRRSAPVLLPIGMSLARAAAVFIASSSWRAGPTSLVLRGPCRGRSARRRGSRGGPRPAWGAC